MPSSTILFSAGGLLATLAGLKLFGAIFFSVRPNEAGVWLRLGKVVYGYHRDTEGNRIPKLLRAGRPGIRFPFTWRLEKILLALQTRASDDTEFERPLPGSNLTQKWVGRYEMSFQVENEPNAIVRATLRAQDREQTACAFIVSAINYVLRLAPVGTLENPTAIFEAAKEVCAPDLYPLGIEWVAVNFIKLARADAQILADAIAGNSNHSDNHSVSPIGPNGHNGNGNGHNGHAKIGLVKGLITAQEVAL